ncbi:hypothetical protein ACFPRL_04635 [Pseudoclavibacter helvolus]
MRELAKTPRPYVTPNSAAAPTMTSVPWPGATKARATTSASRPKSSAWRPVRRPTKTGVSAVGDMALSLDTGRRRGILRKLERRLHPAAREECADGRCPATGLSGRVV